MQLRCEPGLPNDKAWVLSYERTVTPIIEITYLICTGTALISYLSARISSPTMSVGSSTYVLFLPPILCCSLHDVLSLSSLPCFLPTVLSGHFSDHLSKTTIILIPIIIYIPQHSNYMPDSDTSLPGSGS